MNDHQKKIAMILQLTQSACKDMNDQETANFIMMLKTVIEKANTPERHLKLVK